LVLDNLLGVIEKLSEKGFIQNRLELREVWFGGVYINNQCLLKKPTGELISNVGGDGRATMVEAAVFAVARAIRQFEGLGR